MIFFSRGVVMRPRTTVGFPKGIYFPGANEAYIGGVESFLGGWEEGRRERKGEKIGREERK